jgi:carboxypeptidase family protein/TonB-dependent receptor-like protein
MKRRFCACLAILCLCVLVVSNVPAFGQAVYGSIIGTVTDPQGAAVPGAKVTVIDERKGTKDTATTNDAGNYSVTHLVPDTYTVRVEAPGFKVSEQKGIIVNADAAARVDSQFQVGSTTESVEVTAEAPQLKTDRADVATTFNEKYVEDIPILNRNFTTLQLMAPGSQKIVGWSHAATENPQGSQQIFTQGQHFSGTAYELDGTDNQDPILGIIVVNPNLDAVTEAKVALQNYDAEFGKAVSSVVTAQTKSGSNDLHGSAFYYRRTDATEARDPFAQSTADPVTRRFIPSSRWQQFGGTLGGPIIKNKLFFFGDYQGTRQSNGVSGLFTVPTARVQSTCNPATNTTGFCDLSDYVNVAPGGGLIYNPNTGNLLNGTGRTQFTGNLIPIGMISKAAGAILAALPPPQTTNVLNNFVGAGSGPFSQNSFDVRSDFQQSSSMHIFGRYSQDYFTLSGKGLLGPIGGPGNGLLGLAGSSITHNYSLASGFDKVISPTLLTDFRFGYFKYNPQTQKPDAGTPMAAFGIPGANDIARDPKTVGLGSFQLGKDPISGFNGAPNQGGNGLVISSFGDGLGVARCNCPLTESEQQFQFVNNWTKMKGNHQIKFGADIRYAMNLRVPSDNNRTGEYNFSPEGTSNGGIGGLDLATFLLGDVTSFARYVTNPTLSSALTAAERQKRWFFYGQDTFRLTAKLTINYGLRWEIYFPESVNAKGNGGFANIVDNGGLGGIRVAGFGRYGLNGNVDNTYRAFAPRFGIAYELTPKTVVRMGYGRSYDIGVFGSNFGHTVTQNLPVLLKQNFDASNFTNGASGNLVQLFNLDTCPTGPPATCGPGPTAPGIGATSSFAPVPADGFIPLTSQLSGTHIRPTKQVLPTVDAWNVTVQRQLTNSLSAEIAYVGSKGTHGFAGDGPNYDVNPVAAGPGTSLIVADTANPGKNKFNGFSATTPSNERRPLCVPDALGNCTRIGFDLGNYYGNDAASTYNAFEVKVDKRFSQGLQFLSHYTFSHADNYTDQYYAIDHRVAWGPVDFNRNHVFVFNTVYELPFGKGKKFAGGAGRGLDYAIGGWQISNTTNWSSGLPWTPSISECGAFFDGNGPCRPNKAKGSMSFGVGPLDPVNHTRTFFTPVAPIVDPNAFPAGTDVCSLAGASSGPFALPACGTIGNIGKNVFHGPRGFYSDLSVSKSFAITERLRAKFIMDAFNIFNHPVFAFSANNGANGCVDCQGGNNGKITGLEGGTNMRQLQFALRFDF